MNSSPVGSETAWAIAATHNGGARCRVDAEAEDVGAGVVPDRVELASLETDQVDVDLGVENPFLLFERASEDPSAGSDDRGQIRPRHIQSSSPPYVSSRRSAGTSEPRRRGATPMT